MNYNEHYYKDLLAHFAVAWGSKNVDAVMRFFSSNCVYETSVGPDPGTTYTGSEEVRRGIEAMFAFDDGSKAEVHEPFVSGTRGAWEWIYSWPADTNGTKIVRGCDLFDFEDGKIQRKNAFRKTSA